MADSHKNYIRERLVQGLQSTHSKLRTAFGMVISAVANFDWPESWPILMPQLLHLLQSPNQGSLRHIRILTSAIRPRFRSLCAGVISPSSPVCVGDRGASASPK